MDRNSVVLGHRHFVLFVAHVWLIEQRLGGPWSTCGRSGPCNRAKSNVYTLSGLRRLNKKNGWSAASNQGQRDFKLRHYPTVYEDAGISGGTLERPGLQRLLADIDAGLVDQIVVYKVDRLTRSLSDFAKLVERLEAAGAVFVSVTQSFNTATSMGRLTLHMLLSFAQFEREVTAERIRDKVAASKRKGLWMGGRVPLGYEKDGRTLRINEAEAETVRTLYALYRKHGTLRQVKAEADRLRLRTKQRFAADGTRTGGLSFRRGHLHCLLTNPLYAGRIRHQRRVYEGQHPSIIAPKLWDAVQTQLQAGAANQGDARRRAAQPVPRWQASSSTRPGTG